jgi:carboxymethylenebutenolidase
MRRLATPWNHVLYVAVLAGLAVWGTPRGACAQDAAAEKRSVIAETRDSFTSGKAKIQALRFEQPSQGKQPGLILLHGCEGWSDLLPYRFIARTLAQEGYVVILIRYYDRTSTPDEVPARDRAEFLRWTKGEAAGEKRSAAREAFDAWIETVGDAIAYARKRPNVDPHRIGLVGCSLGGYVAVSAAARSDFQVGAVVELFGGLPEEKRKSFRKLPPMLVLHGEDDDVVPVKEAHAIVGLLTLRKQTVEAEIFAGVGHCFIPPGKTTPDIWVVMRAGKRTTSFLNKHLRAGVAVASTGSPPR